MAIAYNSNYDLTIPFSDISVSIALQANVEETYTVPGAATIQYSCKFGYNDTSNIFVSRNVTATVPAAGTATLTPYIEFKPGCDGSQRYVNGGDVLHFITPDALQYMSISLRQLN